MKKVFDYWVMKNAGVLLLLAVSTFANASLYTIDGTTNVVSGNEANTNSVWAHVPGDGEFTLTLTGSTFKENVNNANAQRHVMVWGNSTYGDYRTFTLNGIGDSITLTKGDDLRLFFLDSELWSDNAGSSTVELRQGGNLINTYTIDAKTNVIGGAQVNNNAVWVDFATPGMYKFTLNESTFKENWGTSPQKHIVVMGNSNYGDMRVFTLNGLGDSEVLNCTDSVRMFFLDTVEVYDNDGYSVVEVTQVPEPASLLLIGSGIAGIMTTRKKHT